MNNQLIQPPRWARRIALVAISLLVGLVVGPGQVQHVSAQDGYQRISGEGSSWAANAIDAMRVNVRQFGITVDYNPSGSTSGRKNFLNGTVDFAASDIPFQFEPEDGSAPENPAPGSYAYMPVVAGGTAFMYNLIINGQRVTNLRLSGENVTKIFTGAITVWNDPLLQSDNPGITLPGRPIVPVVRSDGSGSTAQFTQWMINRHGGLWNDYCERSGRAPACGFTSQYPTISGMIAQSGDLGIAGYVSQSFAEGAIGYVNYSYALGVQFPVAKVLNAAGFYTEPTPDNVAVSLLQARINTDESNPAVYLTQQLEGVYTDTDPRNYQLSSYSYFILPTQIGGQFNEAKGRTLGAFAYYAMCQAQQQSASLGYSPMPINLVEASFEQIRKIPGVIVQDINISSCKNPTFSADGTNELANNAPRPQSCDQQGLYQCPDGTGGMQNVPTATVNPVAADAGGTGGAAADAGTVGAADAGTGSDAGSGSADGAEPSEGTVAGTGTASGTAVGTASGSGTATGSTGSGTATGSTGSGTATGSTGSGTAAGSTGSGTAAGTAPGTGGFDAAGNPVAGDTGDPLGAEATQTCDPDTGLCGPPVGAAAVGTAAATPANDQVASGPAIGAITPVTLKPGGGWSSAFLMILVVLLTLGLVLAPAYAWRYFASGKLAHGILSHGNPA